jgi:hypothetical protein
MGRVSRLRHSLRHLPPSTSDADMWGRAILFLLGDTAFGAYSVGRGSAPVSNAPVAPVLAQRDLALLRMLDHVHWRSVSALPARPAFQRPLQVQDRRIARMAHRIERDAGGSYSGGIRPQANRIAVEALRDGRRRLCGPAVAFHLNRPRVSLGAISSRAASLAR